MRTYWCRSAFAVATFALLFAGCGQATADPAATPSPPPPEHSTPPQAPTRAASPTAPTPAASTPRPRTTLTASEAPFGVDEGAWPITVRASKPLLRALPNKLSGQPRELHVNEDAESESGAVAAVSYGASLQLTVSQEYITKDTPSGKPEVFTANDLLSANFGLGAVCDPATYKGTAPSHGYDEKGGATRGGGMGPAVGNRSKKSVWFSCRIADTQGEQLTAGYALGWTSGKTAWLILGDTESAVRAMVTALRTAQ